MRRTDHVGILAALVVAAAAALFIVLHQPRTPDPDLQPVLTVLDAAIAGGYLSTARETLTSMPLLPRGETAQLSLLKRAFRVSMGSGDFQLLGDLAGRALAQNGRSQRIRAIAAYGDLRAGNISDAEKILARNAPAGEAGEMLRGELRLRRGFPWPGSDALTRELVGLEGTTDPSSFAAASMRAGDTRLSLDAALLAMQHGAIDTAARIVRRDLDESRFDEAAALVLYDAGDFGGAAARLKRLDAVRPGIPAIGLQIADMFSAAGNGGEAERWLQRTLPRAPSLSWTPYANLALFAMDRGQPGTAARLLEDGRAFFPGSRQLRLMQARLDIQSGDSPAAEKLLTALLAERPTDGEAALLLLALQGPSLSPEASRARLWKLFDLVPGDAAVFDALASALIAARDWEGMRIAVRQNQDAGGQPDARILVLQGFASAMSDDPVGATAAFRRASLLARDGTARFNIALVMLRRGAARAALAELDGAAAEADAAQMNGSGAGVPGPARSETMSRIETLRGAARLLDGDVPGAGAALSRALALDPHNLRAGLLLRKLEAGGQ